MAIKLEDKDNVLAPNSTYPYGAIQDDTGHLDGTPVNVQIYGDSHQYFAKLLAESGITVNGLPDNADNTFQYFEALINVINKNVGSPLFKAMFQNYTIGDLIKLFGCVVTANIPGTSSITAGAIYYNGKVYLVNAASFSSPDGLVFKINSTVNPNTIFLSNGVSGSGISDYNDITVKNYFVFQQGINNVYVNFSTPTSGLTLVNPTMTAIKNGSTVRASGYVQINSSANVGSASITINLTNAFKGQGSLVAGLLHLSAKSNVEKGAQSIPAQGNIGGSSSAISIVSNGLTISLGADNFGMAPSDTAVVTFDIEYLSK